MAKGEIVFTVAACRKTAGFVARWDDAPGHGGITTQGETLADLEKMIADAAAGYFDPDDSPEGIRIQFAEDVIRARPT